MEIESFENIDNYKIGTGTTESHEVIQISVCSASTVCTSGKVTSYNGDFNMLNVKV